MKLLKALMISMSVGCFRAYQKITLIKEQHPHQFTSADFRLPRICCQSTDPKILWICVRKWTSPRSAHTSVTLAHLLPPPCCPPRWPWHHDWTGAHVPITPPPASNLCPNVMHRNGMHGNALVWKWECLWKQDCPYCSVITGYKKNEKPQMLVLLRKTNRNRPSLLNRNRHTTSCKRFRLFNKVHAIYICSWSSIEDARKQACKCSSHFASRNRQKTKRKTTEDMVTDVFRGSPRTEDMAVYMLFEILWKNT